MLDFSYQSIIRGFESNNLLVTDHQGELGFLSNIGNWAPLIC